LPLTTRSRVETLVLAGLIIAIAAFHASCAMPAPPERTALVYGVADYEGTNNDLNYTDDDARDFGAALYAAGWTVSMGIAETPVEADSQDATLQAIKDDIASLSGYEGLVLFYYSGHGTYDYYNDTSYIIPFGAIENPDEMISIDELHAMFEAAGLAHVVIILDSCHSGGFVEEGATVDAVPPLYGENDPGGDIEYSWFVDALGDAASAYVSYSDASGYVTISAAGAEEYSWESGGHGVFTGAVLDAFINPEADYDDDGYVSTGELFAFAAITIDSEWNDDMENNYAYYDGYQFADFYPHISGTAREYALWQSAP
ncbi:MAG: caspase family protein, partial [Spirochaetales bacterium]|nr:caspase family protein [Spirochaetales bacterium]